MFDQVTELEASRDRAVAEASSILSAAEHQKRKLTLIENERLTKLNAQAESDHQEAIRLKAARLTKTLEAERRRYPVSNSTLLPGQELMPTHFSEEYRKAFHEWVSRGDSRNTLSASIMQEGIQNAGGYAVPVRVDNKVVPLAPQDSAIRRLARVVTTKSDLKIPQQATRGPAAAKPETTAFTVSGPSINQVFLTAYFNGSEQQTSFEIAQDAEYFQQFVLDDMGTAILELEENVFVNGSGVGEAQGLIGNVGLGKTEEPDGNGNLVSISGLYDLIGTLPGKYHEGASFLMNRATAVLIRKAQLDGDFYVPAFTVSNGKSYLLGYPCEFSYAMPSAQRGNTPVLFGSFSDGYIVGDRGGSGISMKILDQEFATSGLIGVYAYRRSDGRVRMPEAIQSYTIAAS
jgi:HK97 family phage major capsid protein